MKKTLLLLCILLGAARMLFAQNAGNVTASSLPVVTIGSQADIHFLSPEPIGYADISTHVVAGDLPVKNVLRVKLLPDSVKHLTPGAGLGVVTITGESFIAQYRLVYSDDPAATVSKIELQPGACRPLDVSGVTLTENQLKSLALRVLDEGKSGDVRHAEAYQLKVTLNHIYTAGDYILLDLEFQNKTQLPYDPDELRFKIEDKKITKATNVQSVELQPAWQLYPLAPFKRRFHNIYVLKKATFPDNKVLNIELSEKQVSGRTLTLKVKYGDILHADTL